MGPEFGPSRVSAVASLPRERQRVDPTSGSPAVQAHAGRPGESLFRKTYDDLSLNGLRGVGEHHHDAVCKRAHEREENDDPTETWHVYAVVVTRGHPRARTIVIRLWSGPRCGRRQSQNRILSKPFRIADKFFFGVRNNDIARERRISAQHARVAIDL